jgi:hypothetical protein
MENYYFLNAGGKTSEGGIEGYDVFLIKKDGLDLNVYAITDKEGVHLLEKTAKLTVKDGKVEKGNITNQELRKFIQLGGFSKIESFTQVK